jgi:hypothetical protein
VRSAARILTDQPHKPGYYRQVWDRTDNAGRTVANGVYFIELRTESEAAKKKVVLVR